ncbi:hypothetical protein [Kineococcus sp. G2]|uniref:hypothetical protein n=1 Tax=Kineococcus sp. G2 TaxID=3127484 RepID=UPI00301DBFA0
MQQPTAREAGKDLARGLAFSLVLVLIAETVHRTFPWDRLWALIAVFAAGHLLRAAIKYRRDESTQRGAGDLRTEQAETSGRTVDARPPKR